MSYDRCPPAHALQILGRLSPLYLTFAEYWLVDMSTATRPRMYGMGRVMAGTVRPLMALRYMATSPRPALPPGSHADATA